MSTDTRRQHRPEMARNAANTFTKTEQELSQGYLEVEISGITAWRLAVAYVVLVRNGWNYTLDSVRSFLRPTPAL